MGTAWEGAKGAVTGAAASLGGEFAAPLGSMAGAGSEIAAMTTAGSLMNGKLPKPQDFVDGAIVIGGIHAITSLAPKLRNIYANTGETPAQVADVAERDVQVKQDLLRDGPELPVQAKDVSVSELQHFSQSEGNIPSTEEQVQTLQPSSNEPSRTPEEQEILDKIGQNPEAPSKTAKESFDEWYADSVNKLDPMVSAILDAKDNGAEINPLDNSYTMGRKFAVYMDKVRSFLENGTEDEKGNINGEGLNDVMREAADIDNGSLNGFRAYGMAKRALEVASQDKTPWANFNAEGAQAVVDASADKYEPLNQRRIDFGNRVLDYVNKKGLISDESNRRIKNAVKQYFPLSRVQEADSFTGKVGGTQVLKRFYGDDANILDPVLQTYKNTEILIREALKNEIRSTFVDELRQGGLVSEGENKVEEPYLEKVPTKVRAITADSEELSAALKKQGIDLTPSDITFFRPEQSYLKENEMSFIQDGRRVTYTGEPDLIRAMRSLDGDKTATDAFTKILSVFAKVEREGVVKNPLFGLKHFLRSQTMGWWNSKTGMRLFIDPALAMKDFFTKSDEYVQWLSEGGATGDWNRISADYLENNRLDETYKEMPFIDKVWNRVKKASEMSEAFIRATDNLTRFSEYKRAIAQGLTPQEATTLSREVVPDPQKSGAKRSFLRMTTPFIGYHVINVDQMFRSALGKTDIDKLTGLGDLSRKQFLIRGAYISALSALNWYANKDDKAIDELSPWRKALCWNTAFHRPDGTAFVLSFPKPWAPGVVFGTGTEAMLDALNKDKPHLAEDFFSNLLGTVIPTPAIAAFKPILEQFANKNLNTGHDLVSQDKEKLLPDLQYEPYTSDTARAIGKILGFVGGDKIGPHGDPISSPAVVENYIKSWAGPMGSLVLRLSDELAHAAGVGRVHMHDTDTIADAPFMNAFLTRYPMFNAQSVTDFYRNKQDTDQVMNSVKYSAKHGDFDSVQAISQAHPDLMLNLDRIGENISVAKKFIQNIQDADMDKTQKRQIIDKALLSIISQAQIGNERMNEFRKMVKGK